MTDDAAVLLRSTRQESGHVDERDQRDVERVAEPDESRGFVGGVDVQRAGHDLGLVRDDSDRVPVEVGEADDHVHRVVRLNLEEVAMIDHHSDHILDVVGLLRIVRDDGGEPGLGAFRVVGGVDPRRLVFAALRYVFEEVADLGEALLFTLSQEMRDARLDVVHLGSAQRVERDVLARGDPYDFGACDEHVADPVHHEREVGDRRRVDSAAGAGAEDQAQLGDHAARLHVSPEDLSVSGEGDNTFLDARAARVVDSDDRDPVGQREVHHLDDLLGEDLAQRAAEDARVVAEQHHVATGDSGHAGDHAIAGDAFRLQPEAARAMGREEIDLLERVAVDQSRDAFTRRELALGVLSGERLGVTVAGFVFPLAQLVERVDLAVAGRGRHQR